MAARKPKLRPVWLIVDRSTGEPCWSSQPYPTRRLAEAFVGDEGLVVKYAPVARKRGTP